MPKLQLGFHTTFALKKEDVLKVLKAALEDKGLDDSLSNLMQRTGLGNKKVGPMRSWAIRSGLATSKALTPEGQLIVERDPYLDSLLTDWFMHFHLSFGDKGLTSPPDDPSDWGGWTWFVYDYARTRSHFTQEELVQHSSTIFTDDSIKTLTKNFKILLRAYTEPTALSRCGYLLAEGDRYLTGEVQLPPVLLIGYFLARLWERDCPTETSILTKTLLEQPLGLAAVLGISSEQLQMHLNALETYNVIEQRREVPPFQIVRRWDSPLTLLEKAYDQQG